MSLTAFTRGALRFDVTDQGPADADETVLLLHGFPQTSASWGPVAAHLHAAGLRTLAPDQRGYSPGARPTGRAAYRLEHLVDDAAALIESSGAGSVHVVGHDWGAIVAWALAAHRPELVRSVTGVSVPHPAAFVRAMYAGPQLPHSWYIGAFQLPGLPEALLGDERRMAAVLRRGGRTARPPAGTPRPSPAPHRPDQLVPRAAARRPRLHPHPGAAPGPDGLERRRRLRHARRRRQQPALRPRALPPRGAAGPEPLDSRRGPRPSSPGWSSPTSAGPSRPPARSTRTRRAG